MTYYVFSYRNKPSYLKRKHLSEKGAAVRAVVRKENSYQKKAKTMKIAFATNNSHKLEEVRNILGPSFEVVSLADIGCHADIPETGTTLEENAMIKAEYVFSHYNISVFADDTGLEVEALGGEPGVYSARYAGGEGHDSEANMRKLLHSMEGKENRKAHFRTVIAFILKKEDGSEPERGSMDGIVEGVITKEKRGDSGFGYDPIFLPDGYEETFAEMPAEVKNKISHRARAVEKFARFLAERR